LKRRMEAIWFTGVAGAGSAVDEDRLIGPPRPIPELSRERLAEWRRSGRWLDEGESVLLRDVERDVREVVNFGGGEFSLSPSYGVPGWSMVTVRVPDMIGVLPLGFYRRINVKAEDMGEDHRAQYERAYERYLLESRIDGLFVGFPWGRVEPAEGEIRWEFLDFWLRLGEKYGKRVMFMVTAGAKTPSWVFEAGATRFPFIDRNRYHSTYGETLVTTVPWDPVFLKEWTRMVRSLGERYASNRALAAVCATGPAKTSGEMHLPNSPEDMERWEHLGLTQERVVEAWKRCFSAWADSFPQKALVLTVSKLNIVPRDAVAEIVEYALTRYPGRVVLRSAGLNGKRPVTRAFADWGFSGLMTALNTPIFYGWLGSQPERMGDYGVALQNARATGACGLTIGDSLWDPRWEEALTQLRGDLLSRWSAA